MVKIFTGMILSPGSGTNWPAGEEQEVHDFLHLQTQGGRPAARLLNLPLLK